MIVSVSTAAPFTSSLILAFCTAAGISVIAGGLIFPLAAQADNMIIHNAVPEIYAAVLFLIMVLSNKIVSSVTDVIILDSKTGEKSGGS